MERNFIMEHTKNMVSISKSKVLREMLSAAGRVGIEEAESNKWRIERDNWRQV
jgi:3-methyladenine DNA glycosylase Mpg